MDKFFKYIPNLTPRIIFLIAFAAVAFQFYTLATIVLEMNKLSGWVLLLITLVFELMLLKILWQMTKMSED